VSFSDPSITVVTGVAGFLGSAVARALAAQGRRVRGIVRASSPRQSGGFPRRAGGGRSARCGRGRIGHAGGGALYHVAADYRLWARNPREILDNNLAMTRAVMEAALSAGVSRVVYTSSVATLLPIDGGVSDETHPATQEQATGIYKQSKVAAERLVEEMVETRGLPAVIVNPSTPIGPRDVRPTPTGRVVVEAANGKMPAYVDSGLNLVHVDDVANGHLLAEARGQVGRRYVLGGQDVTLGQMLADIAALVGRKPPKVKLPIAPLFPIAAVAELGGMITGREPFVTLDSLRMARHRMFYSSARAEAELGYHARPYQQALGDAVAWFRDAGMIA
jgi:dihydroflavonol-4-reductase